MTVARCDPPPGRRSRLGLATAALALLPVGAPAAVPAQAFLDLTDQDSPYRLFPPPGLDPAAPARLVVMLHGCRQDAATFAAVTRQPAG